MKAFVNCKVSKDEVLGSLKMHQAADRFRRGIYWEDGKGCSTGCTIHDFAPGEESNNSLYPELFGLPESFAYLQDRIFEGLPLEDSKKWSVNVISAIPEGCDVSKKIDEFVYWILSGGDSPISKYRDNKEIKAVTELYRQKLKGEKIKPEEWEKAEDDAKARVYAAANAASAANAANADDVAYVAAAAAEASDAAAAAAAIGDAAYYATRTAERAVSTAVYDSAAADDAVHANVAYAFATNITATYVSRATVFKKIANKLIKKFL